MICDLFNLIFPGFIFPYLESETKVFLAMKCIARKDVVIRVDQAKCLYVGLYLRNVFRRTLTSETLIIVGFHW
jgi:hypothetical protein